MECSAATPIEAAGAIRYARLTNRRKKPTEMVVKMRAFPMLKRNAMAPASNHRMTSTSLAGSRFMRSSQSCAETGELLLHVPDHLGDLGRAHEELRASLHARQDGR